MNKNEFLLKLKEHTSKEEGERLYHYYSEIIEDRLEVGEAEEAIIAGFGDISKIIQEAEATRKVRDFEEKPRLSTGVKALMAVLLVFASPFVLAIGLPLVITAIVLVIVLFVVLAVIVISFFAAAVAGLLSIIVGIVTLFTTPAVGLFQIGTGFVGLGIGVLCCFLAVKLTLVALAGVQKLCGALIRRFMENRKGGVINEN